MQENGIQDDRMTQFDVDFADRLKRAGMVFTAEDYWKHTTEEWRALMEVENYIRIKKIRFWSTFVGILSLLGVLQILLLMFD